MSDSEEQLESIGRYTIVEELSKSSRSRVLKAVLPPSRQEVVVKVLPDSVSADPERVEQFQKDAQALSKINHSNVALILDSGSEGESLFLVMELVPLTPLSRLLRRRRLTLAQAILVFKNLCLGMRAVHAQEVIHQNINPTSVLVSDDLSMIKVAGFGSRAHQGALSSDMETMATGRLNVAIHYVAPELLKTGKADERSDIYSLGVVLYEMLTGRLPMGRVGLPSRINPDLPTEIDRLVLDCLATKAEDRFGSVDQVLQAVQRIEDRQGLSAVREFHGLVRGTSRIVRHRAATLALLGVVGAALIGGGAYWFFGRGNGDDTQQADATRVQVTAPQPLARPSFESEVEETDTEEALDDDSMELGLDAEESIDAGAPGAAGPTSGSAPQPAAPRTDASLPSQPPADDPPASESSATESPGDAPAAQAAPAPDLASDLAVAREKLAASLPSAAITDLEQLVAAHPNSPVALDAYLLLAHIHSGQQQTEAAQAALVEARSRFSGDPRAAEAVFQLAELTAAERGRENQDQARVFYGEVAAQYPRSKWAPKALSARARLEANANLKAESADFDRPVPAALLSYRELVKRYPRARYAEDALWNLGEMYRDLKYFDLAAQAYVKLGNEFPDTRRDTWWEAAQLFDKRLDDKAAAVDAYSKVSDSSTHYEAAQKRRKKLGG